MVPCIETPFRFGAHEILALVPDATTLNAQHPVAGASAPYWARIWPAGLGLAQFLAAAPEHVAGKRVLELAAGLGLPGLLAARTAAQVTLSDIDPEAVDVMRATAARNGLQNVDCMVIDWCAIPDTVKPDVVLLSDVNYDPAVFDQLFLALTALLDRGIPILLSTPQRLMAKPFIARLQPRVMQQEEVQVGTAFVSVFLLH
jgi:predicted nicotinamide N-methyase